jgi:hypothetical protein
MSNEEKELFFSILEEAYQKGMTSSDISVDSLYNEIKQKLSAVIAKKHHMRKEV